MKIGVEDIKGVVGIVPTPATPDADRWECANSIDFDQTRRMVDAIVSAGVDILMTTGTFGECATLTEPELCEYVRCVAETVRGRVPLFAGITTLNTRDTIRRGRELLEAGADGLFVGRPMWLPLDQRAIVDFYGDVADALKRVPLVIYDNPFAFRGKIAAETYQELGKIPELIASKHVGGPSLESDALALGKAMRLLPLEIDWIDLARTQPDLAQACWSGNVACAPLPVVELSRAIAQGNWPRAEALTTKLRQALAPMYADDFEAFMIYSIQLGHARFNAAGLVDVGPCRPPYTKAPPAMLAGAAKAGRLLAELQKELLPA